MPENYAGNPFAPVTPEAPPTSYTNNENATEQVPAEVISVEKEINDLREEIGLSVEKDPEDVKEEDLAAYVEGVTSRAIKGERLSNKDWLALAHDCTIKAEKSELARSYMSKFGFETFNDAMGKLDVKSVDAGELSARIEKSGASQYLKNLGKAALKSTIRGGVGAGISYGSLALLHLAFPALFAVSGAAIVGAAIGSEVGRFVGRSIAERNRRATLHSEIKDSEGKPTGDTLGEKAAQDLLSRIGTIQAASRELVSTTDPEARAAIFQKIVDLMASKEIESLKQYKDLEKKTQKTRFWYGFAGSIIGSTAGAAIGSWIHGQTEAAATIAEKGKEGFSADFDKDGTSHVVKKGVDNAWHYVIDRQQDITNKVTELTHNNDLFRDWASNYLNQNYHYLTEPAGGHITDLTLPGKTGEFLHLGKLALSPEAIIKYITGGIMERAMYSGAVVAGMTPLGGLATKNLLTKNKTVERNLNFIKYIEGKYKVTKEPTAPTPTPSGSTTEAAATPTTTPTPEAAKKAEEEKKKTEEVKKAEKKKPDKAEKKEKPEGTIEEVRDMLAEHLKSEKNQYQRLQILEMKGKKGSPFYVTEYYKFGGMNVSLYLSTDDQKRMGEIFNDPTRTDEAIKKFRIHTPVIKTTKGVKQLKVSAELIEDYDDDDE